MSYQIREINHDFGVVRPSRSLAGSVAYSHYLAIVFCYCKQFPRAIAAKGDKTINNWGEAKTTISVSGRL